MLASSGLQFNLISSVDISTGTMIMSPGLEIPIALRYEYSTTVFHDVFQRSSVLFGVDRTSRYSPENHNFHARVRTDCESMRSNFELGTLSPIPRPSR